MYTQTVYLLMCVKSLMGFKICCNWGVDKQLLKPRQVRVFLKNHAQLPKTGPVFSIKSFKNPQNRENKSERVSQLNTSLAKSR